MKVITFQVSRWPTYELVIPDNAKLEGAGLDAVRYYCDEHFDDAEEVDDGSGGDFDDLQLVCIADEEGNDITVDFIPDEEGGEA